MRFYLTLSAADNSIIIRDWDIVQTRSVDPYANVDSDIANNLHMIYGNKNVYFTGLGIASSGAYNINNINSENNTLQLAIILKLNPGTVMMDNVSIKFTEEIKIPLYEFSGNSSIAADSERYVVVEYVYEKVLPSPIAEIKSILKETYEATPSKYLLLYTYKIKNSSQALMLSDTSSETLEAFITAWRTNDNKYSVTDCRFDTGIIFRSGDTMSGFLRILKTPTSNYHAVNKKYVDDTITSTGLSNAVLKSGGTNIISIPILWSTSRTPQSGNELVTWNYVKNNCISNVSTNSTSGEQTLKGILRVSSASGNSGDIRVPNQPKSEESVVNKKYVDDAVGNFTTTSFLKITGGTLRGNVYIATSRLENSTSKIKLINEEYADKRYVMVSGSYSDANYNTYLKGPLRADTSSGKYTIENDSGNISTLVTKKYCDNTYLTSSSIVTFQSVPKLNSSLTINNNYQLVTKKYCDDNYIKNSNIVTNQKTNDNYAGSLKMSNGFIMKWGLATVTGTFSISSWFSVTFDTTNPFTTNCYNIVVTWLKGGSGDNNQRKIYPCVKDVASTGFKLNLGDYTTEDANSSETFTFYYQAIGK